MSLKFTSLVATSLGDLMRTIMVLGEDANIIDCNGNEGVRLVPQSDGTILITTVPFAGEFSSEPGLDPQPELSEQSNTNTQAAAQPEWLNDYLAQRVVGMLQAGYKISGIEWERGSIQEPEGKATISMNPPGYVYAHEALSRALKEETEFYQNLYHQRHEAASDAYGLGDRFAYGRLHNQTVDELQERARRRGRPIPVIEQYAEPEEELTGEATGSIFHGIKGTDSDSDSCSDQTEPATSGSVGASTSFGQSDYKRYELWVDTFKMHVMDNGPIVATAIANQAVAAFDNKFGN